jgi:hypothetical protein
MGINYYVDGYESRVSKLDCNIIEYFNTLSIPIFYNTSLAECVVTATFYPRVSVAYQRPAAAIQRLHELMRIHELVQHLQENRVCHGRVMVFLCRACEICAFRMNDCYRSKFDATLTKM